MMKVFGKWKTEGYANELIWSTSAMPDTSKNLAVGVLEPYVVNAGLTSYNRNRLVMESDAEYIFFVDHDTVPPDDALPKLLALGVPFAAGVYFYKGEKKHPLIYTLDEMGLYRPVIDYNRGEILEVDGVGMGCTLIHRDVFKAIRDKFLWIMHEEDGSQELINRTQISDRKLPAKLRTPETRLYGDDDHGYYMVTPVKRVSQELEERFEYPYYDMAHGRTEDLPFCKRVQACGIPILIDTSIECGHVGETTITAQDFVDWRNKAIMGESE